MRAAALALLLWASHAVAGALQPETLDAFQVYADRTEQRIATETARADPFFHYQTLPSQRRHEAEQALDSGEVFIERLETRDPDGREFEIPHGLIHHWLGVTRIPGVTLEEVQRVVRDYDRHVEVYPTDVTRSRLLARDGDDYWVYLRFKKKKVVTVVLDTEHDVRYRPLGPCRWLCRSATTRVTEIEDPGTGQEREKRPDQQGGFLWHIYSYWRFEETAAGVTIECESISLTRDIPLALRWLVKPFVTGVPLESLRSTLLQTRRAVERRPSAGR